MKKIILALAFVTSFATINFAQTTGRKTTTTATENAGQVEQTDKKEKKSVLTPEERQKLKEQNQATKAKRDEIKNNTNLSEEERKAQMKELRKEHKDNVRATVGDEKADKMEKMKKDKMKGKMKDKKDGKGKKNSDTNNGNRPSREPKSDDEKNQHN
jgi:hypothetical protein